jgi:hypothetical protein
VATVGTMAPTESLWGSLKVARLHGRHFATRRAAMDEIVDWPGFYNSRRLHSTLDYVSPMTFGQNWFAAQHGEAASFPQLWDSRNGGKLIVEIHSILNFLEPVRKGATVGRLDEGYPGRSVSVHPHTLRSASNQCAQCSRPDESECAGLSTE